MKALIELIIQNYPEFSNEIEGCTEDEITNLEKICPVPMPDTYKVFLRYMGKNPGRIKVYALPKEERAGSIMRCDVFIDYDTVYKSYKRKIKNFLKFNKYATEADPSTLTGDLSEHNEDPSNFFYFGVNQMGNDSGDFFLDIRTPELKVVEIDWYTRGVLQMSPSFIEFLFNDYFRREASTYLHNRQWMDLA
ncbi:MAG: SMI1/KNR4 family protein [Promethearchaeota archaeon]